MKKDSPINKHIKTTIHIQNNMKKLKLSTAIVTFFLFANSIFAVNPSKIKKDDLANILAEKLNKDVQLTNSQKIAIREYTKAFITTMESADSIPNAKVKLQSKEQVSQNYEVFLDSVLTGTQKEQRKIKRLNREKGNNN